MSLCGNGLRCENTDSLVVLILYQKFQVLTTLGKKPFENTLEEGENNGPAFFPFPTMFTTPGNVPPFGPSLTLYHTVTTFDALEEKAF